MKNLKLVQTHNENLPEDTTQALRLLVKTSERLLDITERETQSLIQGDMGVFTVLQDEKEALSKTYAQQAQSFSARISSFRSADPGLLSRLENIQKELSEKNKSNLKLVENMFQRSQKNIENSLLTVQELSQQYSARIPKTENKD